MADVILAGLDVLIFHHHTGVSGMSLLPQQPVSIAKLLDLSFRLYFASFKSLLGLSVILSAAYILFAYFTVDLLTPAAGAEGTAAEFAPDFTGFLGAMSVFVLLTFIFYG